MEDKKYILGLLFVFLVSISQAQENRVFVPPDKTLKTYTFVLPELRVDSTFIACLNTILFDKKYQYMNWILSNPNSSRSLRHFYIHFEEKDSLNYSIQIMLGDIPGKNSTGFFERNEYFYWFGDEIPPNIILETKSKKQFSYKEHPPRFIDFPLWILVYNKQDGSIVFKTNDYLEYLDIR